MKATLLTLVLFLACAVPTQAAVGITVGTPSRSTTAGVDGKITSTAMSVTTGDTFLFGVVTCCSTARVISTITDSAGNTWTPASNCGTAIADAASGTTRLCWHDNVTGGASFTVTVTYDNTVNEIAIVPADVSGTPTSSSLDVEPTGHAQASGATNTSGSFTPSAANGMAVALFNTPSTTCGCTADTGYTLTQYNNGTDGAASLGFEYKLNPATSSQTVSMTTTHSGSGSAIVAAVFKASGGAATAPPKLMLLGVGGDR